MHPLPGQIALFIVPQKETEKYDLYGGTPPHVSGSETSHQAAIEIIDHLGELQQRVFEVYLKAYEYGATTDEIQCVLGIGPQTACPRKRELEKMGKICRLGRKRRTRSGRLAEVYVATQFKPAERCP